MCFWQVSLFQFAYCLKFNGFKWNQLELILAIKHLTMNLFLTGYHNNYKLSRLQLLYTSTLDTIIRQIIDLFSSGWLKYYTRRSNVDLNQGTYPFLPLGFRSSVCQDNDTSKECALGQFY